MKNNNKPTLQEIATDIRDVFERLLIESIGGAATKGSCFYACILLRDTITKFYSTNTIIRGGDGEGDGGYTDPKGGKHGHYWVEVKDTNGQNWVVDITADQFGGPKVFVEPLAYTVHQYEPGNQVVIEGHIRDFGV